jgi:hypothetical protein
MSASNVNPVLLDITWSLDGKQWQVLIQTHVSGKRPKWTKFRGPLASMRHTSRLMVEGKRTEVILFQTTDQNDDAPEVAVKLSNFVVGKVGPPNLRKGIGKKKGMALARKLMHINVHQVIVFHVCIGLLCKSFKTWLKEQEVQSSSSSEADEDEDMVRKPRRGARQVPRSRSPEHEEDELGALSADSLESQASHQSAVPSQSSSPESPLPVQTASSSSRSRRSILEPNPSVSGPHVTPQSLRPLVNKRPRSTSSNNSQSSGSRRRTGGGSKKKKAKVSGRSKQRLQPLQGT